MRSFEEYGGAPHEGRSTPVPKIVQVASPAAGADWSITTLAGMIWQVRSIVATLTTSSAVANRQVALTMADSGITFYRAGAPANQAASLGYTYCYAVGAGEPVNNTTALGLTQPLPDIYMRTGSTIVVTTTAIDTADQWSAIALYVIEWERSAASAFDQLVTSAKAGGTVPSFLPPTS